MQQKFITKNQQLIKPDDKTLGVTVEIHVALRAPEVVFVVMAPAYHQVIWLQDWLIASLTGEQLF